MNLSAQIEGLLFWRAEPVAIAELVRQLGATKAQIETALGQLSTALEHRGICLVKTADEVMLGTAPALSELIEKLTKEELARDIGKAGLETLSIILYQGPISRADIDFIRGVNSQFIVRNLLIRGLIERVDNPTDARSFLYKPTLALLAHLGIRSIDELPNRTEVMRDIQSFRAQEAAKSAQSPSSPNVET